MSGPVVSSAQLPDGRIAVANQGKPQLTVWDPLKGRQELSRSLRLPFVSDSDPDRKSSDAQKPNSAEDDDDGDGDDGDDGDDDDDDDDDDDYD